MIYCENENLAIFLKIYIRSLSHRWLRLAQTRLLVVPFGGFLFWDPRRFFLGTGEHGHLCQGKQGSKCKLFEGNKVFTGMQDFKKTFFGGRGSGEWGENKPIYIQRTRVGVIVKELFNKSSIFDWLIFNKHLRKLIETVHWYLIEALHWILIQVLHGRKQVIFTYYNFKRTILKVTLSDRKDARLYENKEPKLIAKFISRQQTSPPAMKELILMHNLRLWWPWTLRLFFFCWIWNLGAVVKSLLQIFSEYLWNDRSMPWHFKLLHLCRGLQ